MKKMMISRNLMKISLKEKLNEGTFVRPETYESMASVMDSWLEGLCNVIVECYNETNDKKITEMHVKEAYFRINMDKRMIIDNIGEKDGML